MSLLQLPEGAAVNRRVPKKTLLEQGAPTAGDRRRIQDGIEELVWLAALKPANIGVPAFRDETRQYLEIAVLSLVLRPGAKTARIVELIHRAIPYPVVLLAQTGDGVSVSLAHKRHSQAEAGKMVVEQIEASKPFVPDVPNEMESAFLKSLALSAQPTQNLFALYQGWMDCVTALAVAYITGGYRPTETTEQAAVRRAALDEHAALDRDIALLRAKAEKEKQVDRLVELNMEIKRLESQLTRTTEKL